jgi:hypothetical protein
MQKDNGFTYDTGVPIPARGSKGYVSPEHRFDQMPVGASKFFPDPRARAAYAASRRTQKRSLSMLKFRGCAVVENGMKGIRIWRVE